MCGCAEFLELHHLSFPLNRMCCSPGRKKLDANSTIVIVIADNPNRPNRSTPSRKHLNPTIRILTMTGMAPSGQSFGVGSLGLGFRGVQGSSRVSREVRSLEWPELKGRNVRVRVLGFWENWLSRFGMDRLEQKDRA